MSIFSISAFFIWKYTFLSKREVWKCFFLLMDFNCLKYQLYGLQIGLFFIKKMKFVCLWTRFAAFSNNIKKQLCCQLISYWFFFYQGKINKFIVLNWVLRRFRSDGIFFQNHFFWVFLDRGYPTKMQLNKNWRAEILT